ncbi:hypothetical protein ISN45_Aa04g029870 [Arabidopsis thaliana x Arabidopsis arenosa]|uniref:GPI-anchored adhesin-like protein n=1 Tax=Arabidopsis thaliana x Arabidopsis arenosa TaxID=1240361 RepID=A0A8T2AEB4_9BRAS|nr:hypothetical protein ISN45_Aa04g029870 [Arabidopsis thaliana x Arabidopsis arenosa]
MNRITSSSNAQTKKFPQSQSQSQPPDKKEKNLKMERFPVNPLRGFSTRSSGSSSSSNVSGSASTSGEASNGCHRFLHSHSFSSSSSSSSSLGVFPRRPVNSVAQTPKSAPVVSKPLIRKKPSSLEEVKLKSTLTEKPNLHKSQRCKTNTISGKRPTCKITMKPEKVSVLKKQSSVSRNVKLRDSQTTIRVDDSIAQSTPVSKLGTGSDLIYRSNGEATDDGRLSSNSSSYQDRTPPVQASVSPEIQCGSSMNLSASTQSQACYAAGHLLSGVSDKRKCKPKGILTVGENGFEVGKGKILNDSDEFDEGDFGNDGSCDNISIMPLPADASVHWLLSPCDEEKEHENEKSDDGFSQLQQIVECVGHETPSPLSDRSASSDLCNISSGRSLSPMDIYKETTRRISSSLSPNELFRFRRFIHLSSCDGEASAFDASPTCELDPSEHLKGDKSSPLSVDTLGSENVIQTPESNSSFDNYFGLSCSQAEIQKKHDVGSDLESLTMNFQSAGLSPRIQASSREPSRSSFNFDSLATSSDSIDLSQFQRALADRSSFHPHVTLDTVSRTHVRVEQTNCHMPEIKSQQITDTKFDMQNHKESAAPLGKERELLPFSAAESISTDGGGLICSEDSNWMACYKN